MHLSFSASFLMALFHSIQKAGGQWASSCSSSRTLFSSRPCPGQHTQKDRNRGWVHSESRLHPGGPGHWAGFSLPEGLSPSEPGFKAADLGCLSEESQHAFTPPKASPDTMRTPPCGVRCRTGHQRLLPSPQSSLRCFCFLCISQEPCSGTQHTRTALSVALSGRPHSHHPWRIQAHLR